MRLKTYLSVIILLSMITTFSACDKAEEQRDAEIKRTLALLLNKDWTVHSVQSSDVDFTDVYNDMMIHFTDNAGKSAKFTCINGEPFWSPEGAIFFSDGTTFSYMTTMTTGKIKEISEHELVISIDWHRNTIGGGRAHSLEGETVFTLKN